MYLSLMCILFVKNLGRGGEEVKTSIPNLYPCRENLRIIEHSCIGNNNFINCE